LLTLRAHGFGQIAYRLPELLVDTLEFLGIASPDCRKLANMGFVCFAITSEPMPPTDKTGQPAFPMPEAGRQVIYGLVIILMQLVYGRGERVTS